LERALEIQPNFPPTLFELALLYLASDRDQDAIDAYQRIISVEPRNTRALLRLCQAYRKVGEFDRAIGFCEDAVGFDPEYVQAFFWLGSLQYRQRNFPSALASFQSCYNLDPTFLECEYLLGLSHYYVGQCETAWNMLQASLVVAQSRADASGAVEDIQSGLVAISSDPQCSVENVQRLRPFPSELFGNRLGNGGGN
jgi:tetratricopeptide (TPR) repeat protein